MLQRSVLIVCMLLMLCACFNDQQDIAEYVEEVKKASLGNVTPLPPPEVFKTREFSSTNLRSPFSPSTSAAKTGPIENLPISELKQQPRPDANRPREFLEDYPLSSFVMVGTLSKNRFQWGLLKDADGMVHAVKVGDYIGENSGQIVQIMQDQIRILETVPDGAGGWMHTKKVLKLYIPPPPPPPQEQGAGQEPGSAPAHPNAQTSSTTQAPGAANAAQASPQVTILPDKASQPSSGGTLPTIPTGSQNRNY